MSRLKWLMIVALLAFAGCKQMAATREQPAPPQPIQISAPGVDSAEPATAAAPDGTFYVAWVNHDAKQADVMLNRFNQKGEGQGSPVRVNREPGVATAWRGDQPSVTVASMARCTFCGRRGSTPARSMAQTCISQPL